MGTSIIYGEKKGRKRKKLGYLVAGLAVVAIIVSAYYITRPQPEEVIARDSGELLGALELLSIEYGEAVENGRVVKESEYEGAREVMDRIMDLFGQMKPYAMLVDPEPVESIERDLERLESMVHEKSPPGDVDGLIEQISGNIRKLQA